LTPLETLQHIQNGLTSESPGQVIEALAPKTASGALSWARRLSGWEEFPFPAQVIGVARIISKIAMRAYGLKLTPEGRVVSHEVKGWQDRKPERTFLLAIAGEELLVEYTPDYFPADDTTLFSFTTTPPKPHCLSESGYLSQFVPRDAVDACGGPEAFAAQFAAAKLQGTGKGFMEAFEGISPESKPSRRKPAMKPAVGNHTAHVIDEGKSPPEAKPELGMLF